MSTPSFQTKPTGTRRDNSFSLVTALQSVVSAGFLVATLLTLWTPANLFSNRLINEMLVSMQRNEIPETVLPTSTAAPKPLIGIVAGHWGNDPGAVCENGTTEMDVNLRIATLVAQNLKAEGYPVDLLQEFDPKLGVYQAAALVSIHNDSCDYINADATGFKVAAAVGNLYPEKASRLIGCMINRYQSQTGLRYHENTITPDMTGYHAFDEIHGSTPAAIIETGFLNLDYTMLTEHPDIVARGVTDGILCYVRNEPIEWSTATP